MASVISAGTTSGTSLNLSGDTSGVLQLASNGSTTAVTIDTSQNVGIGTSSPTGKFEVKSANNTGTDSIIRATSNNGTASTWLTFNGVSVSSGNDCVFYVNTTEQARITSTGNFRFNSGYGSSATAYGCRAWVNFNGTGTPAIRASGNVTSITDDGAGLYTVNFTTAMPDANYCVAGAAAKADGGDNNTNMRVMGRNAAVAQTTSAVAVGCYYQNGNTEDGGLMCVAIFR